MASLGMLILQKIMSIKGWATDLALVSSSDYPFVKYGPPESLITPLPTPVPTPTPTPAPLPTISPEDARALNEMCSSIVPSGLDKHASSFSLPSIDLFGSNSTASNAIPAQTHASPLTSIGFPGFMDMDLFSPTGFISFVGLAIAITLPLLIICWMAFKGSFWYLVNRPKN